MPSVALYITCLADQLFPRVGKATVALLHRLGVRVRVPRDQTCCGQPAFNAGYRREALAPAARVVELLRECSDDEPLLVPSGSCALMIRRHYAELFPREDPALFARAIELSEYLTTRLGLDAVPGAGAGRRLRLGYHDSCHLLRGLRVADGPRRLLAAAEGVELVDLDPRRECCGFGGTFSVKMPAISADMAHGKVAAATALDVDAVVAGDAGCLMNIGGALRRATSRAGVLHYAQVLAGPAFCDLL